MNGENKVKYVAGFLFNPTMDSVVLVKKNRPEWQKGFYNGVGGHIEQGENPFDAMTREFEEETGVLIPDWRNYCEIDGEDWVCYFFCK